GNKKNEKINTNNMDTGDLSDRAYKAILKAILVEAEKFNHDLTLQFGLLSDECENESIFIKKSASLINEMIKYDASELDDMFFGNPPSKKEFHITLKKIMDNIQKIKK
ncbi:MAG TPA: hypothetical protein VN958_09675, partial [Chitinophagaceae bacterium]|nr:hypothetical protein [Chitinophagaceae bacterium]